MSRIFGEYVYGEGPRENCWWTQTCQLQEQPTLSGDLVCDVAVVGGGFTGLNAALTLAKNGVKVVLLEAQSLGWGASGRNGGFCCLGGGVAQDNWLDRHFGISERLKWRRTEAAAVSYVSDLLTSEKLDVDRHSDGETWLAHRRKDMKGVTDFAAKVRENYGVDPKIHEISDLPALGLKAGFHGAVTIPIGFGLNPRKYLAGLIAAVLREGAILFEKSHVTQVRPKGESWDITCRDHHVTADKVIFATNGYSSENIPTEIAGRYMPVQSNVAVTRPLLKKELEIQGWTSRQMCYDSRNLLHYFRLLPDNRVLFGLRGGLLSSKASEARARRRLSRDFRRMFSTWKHVELTHHWSGLACIARGKLPFVGEIPSQSGLLAAMCYHGNGIAMGSFAGSLVGKLALGNHKTEIPQILQTPLPHFPFGRARRIVMPPIYAGFSIADL